MGLFSFLNKRKGSSAGSRQNQRQAGRIFPVPAGAPAADAYAFSGTPDEYFSRTLRNCFPGYDVQPSTNVNSGTGDWVYFLLVKNKTPKAAIFLVDRYSWNTREIANAMDHCKRNRIPCVRFIRQFRNQAGYIVERINGVLR